ncbi:hypothetical protein ACROYT_G041492 [Oculina patagonica]
MKKGSLVVLIALSALLVVFSDQVTGQWAGMNMPNGKRDSNFGDNSKRQATTMTDYCNRCSSICRSSFQEFIERRRR